MRRTFQLVVTKAANGFTIRTQGDTPAEDNALLIAGTAEEAIKLGTEALTKSLAEKAPPATT